MKTAPRIIVTDEDLDRLNRLIEQHSFWKHGDQIELLEAELARAEIVTSEELPQDVVTMNSLVLFQEEESGVQRTIQLVWPHEVNGDASRVSVFAPVGTALLGMSAGGVIETTMPGGRTKRLRVLKVLYQPEGDERTPPPGAA